MSGSPGELNEELCSFSNLSITSPTSQLILQPVLLLYLCHSSFSNPSVASPTSQLILRPFFCFSYVTGFSLTSPGEPPMTCSTKVFDDGSAKFTTRDFECMVHLKKFTHQKDAKSFHSKFSSVFDICKFDYNQTRLNSED